jgi:hypothetical protein
MSSSITQSVIRRRLVYERKGMDIFPRLVGRFALFQAYTSVLSAPPIILGYLKFPPALDMLNHSNKYILSAAIASIGVGTFFAVRELNSKIVTKLSVVVADDTATTKGQQQNQQQMLEIETISSIGKKDVVQQIPINQIQAGRFVPNSLQMLKLNKKNTVVVDHSRAKLSDVVFFSSTIRN